MAGSAPPPLPKLIVNDYSYSQKNIRPLCTCQLNPCQLEQNVTGTRVQSIPSARLWYVCYLVFFNMSFFGTVSAVDTPHTNGNPSSLWLSNRLQLTAHRSQLTPPCPFDLHHSNSVDLHRFTRAWRHACPACVAREGSKPAHTLAPTSRTIVKS